MEISCSIRPPLWSKSGQNQSQAEEKSYKSLTFALVIRDETKKSTQKIFINNAKFDFQFF